MPWLVLPMRYATIVPQYAIYRLLITDLDVNFLWMQTKCDASLDFSFPMLMLLDEDANAIFLLMMLVHAFKPWCKCLLTEMEMRMSFNGYVMMQMF